MNKIPQFCWSVFVILMITTMSSKFALAGQSSEYDSKEFKTRPHHRLNLDLGFAAGSYGEGSYSEINFGLSWFLNPNLIWRNSLFSRSGQGIDSAEGLDSSLLLRVESQDDPRRWGVILFAGPGVRASQIANSAIFGEGGVIFKLKGLQVGAGVKVFNYFETGKDLAGNTLPNQDSVYSLILGF